MEYHQRNIFYMYLALTDKECFLIDFLSKGVAQGLIIQGFWYFAEKFRRIFGGKLAEKLADFMGFLWAKSQHSQKNWPILAERSQISKDFQG